MRPRSKVKPRDPDTRAAIEADGVRLGLGKWEQLDRHGNTISWQSYADGVRAARAETEQTPLPDNVKPRDPDTRAAIEADGVRLGLGKWEQLDRHGNTISWQSYADGVRAARAEEIQGVHQ